MKRFTIFVLYLSFALLSACAAGSNPPTSESGAETAAPVLLVSGGEISKSFTRADVEALPATEAVFNDIAYKGVTVVELKD